MVKSREKKFKIYFRVTANSTNDMVKCHQNVNFEEIDTERSTEKNDGY